MTVYNVLSEVDYYPRHRHAHDLNPQYAGRKRWINDQLAEVFGLSPSNIIARSWIGSAFFILDHPLHDEDDLFFEAAEELERIHGEVAK